MASTLDLYRAKRNFGRTKEPKGTAQAVKSATKGGLFVMHKHAARRLHYDLRLEHDGALWSWAVTRGPSLDPAEKRLAVHVEDHPLEYGGFEGTIPEGEYGAGSVIVWDEGRWVPEHDPAAMMSKGHLSFVLEGHKLRGAWHLVRLKPRRGEKRDNWLLIKNDDPDARRDGDVLEDAPHSVKSGAMVEDIGAAPNGKVWARTKRPGKAAKSRASVPDPASGGAVLPKFVAPCLATLHEVPPAGEQWLHEVKFDGYRLQARLAKSRVRLSTRSGLDWTERFGAPLASALASLPCDEALIDGEVVALDERGISSFSALQEALSASRTDALVFFAFDLLFLDGADLRSEPLLARKERLEHLIAGAHPALRYSEHFVEPGQRMLSHVCRMGLEGVISKRADAPYRSGRGRDWIKSKCTQRQEFVIGGYVPSTSKRRGLGSILVGFHDRGELRFAGRVGPGFTEKSATELRVRLDALKRKDPPFAGTADRDAGIVWVEPDLVAEVEFRAWTASRVLRHATFRGLREDKPADEVVAEERATPPPSPQKGSRTSKPAPRRAGTTVALTNPDKVLWPDGALTKRGLLEYYERAWPLMRPFVVDRPLSLLRAPNGIEGQSFFQKHAGAGMPDAVHRKKDVDGEDLLFINDFDGLAALVQLGTVEIHVWGSTIEAIETPDQIIFDLDPDAGLGIEHVREAAVSVRARLAELGFMSLLKVSGGKGFHVVAPLRPKAHWPRVKAFARDFARAMEQSEPDRYTATLSKKARHGRIFIDYLRNGRGATAIAPYSTRARPGAPISCPIPWSILDAVVPTQFDTNRTLPQPDEWKKFFVTSQSLRAT